MKPSQGGLATVGDDLGRGGGRSTSVGRVGRVPDIVHIHVGYTEHRIVVFTGTNGLDTFGHGSESGGNGAMFVVGCRDGSNEIVDEMAHCILVICLWMRGEIIADDK